MTDEKFDFIQDVRDKKRTARGANNRRTHAGKGGRVKFPSDYLTKKELLAMNGEVKSYRMNSPMKWKEFKSLPDDLKITYIKALREKYRVPNKHIAEMFEIDKSCVSVEFKRLGLANGKCGRRSTVDFDETEWTEFLESDMEAKKQELEEWVKEETAKVFGNTAHMPLVGTRKDESEFIAPTSGSMTFKGNIDGIMRSIKAVLGDGTYTIYINWEKSEDTS